MNPQRPLRDDLTDLEARMRDLESRTSILCAEQIYDAITSRQASEAILQTITHQVWEISVISSKTNFAEKKVERLEQELEQTKKELTEESKKRKQMKIKMDVMYEWFKTQNQ